MQQEFEQRVGMSVSLDEFEAINKVYMASDVDKDEFCMYWKKMNLSRIQEAKRQMKADRERNKKIDAVYDIYMKLQSRQGGFSDYASEVLTKRQRSILESVGIEVEQHVMLTVMHAMRKFIRMYM